MKYFRKMEKMRCRNFLQNVKGDVKAAGADMSFSQKDVFFVDLIRERATSFAGYRMQDTGYRMQDAGCET